MADDLRRRGAEWFILLDNVERSYQIMVRDDLPKAKKRQIALAFREVMRRHG